MHRTQNYNRRAEKRVGKRKEKGVKLTPMPFKNRQADTFHQGPGVVLRQDVEVLKGVTKKVAKFAYIPFSHLEMAQAFEPAESLNWAILTTNPVELAKDGSTYHIPQPFESVSLRP